MQENYFEKTLNGFFVGRFFTVERLGKKAEICHYMAISQQYADEVAGIIMKFLGSARHCLGEFTDTELADMLFFLSPSRGFKFSPKINKGIDTVLSWPEWKKLPFDYEGVKIYTK